MIKLIKPDWNAPENVHAFTTTRIGEFSLKPYDSFNLAHHVNDDINKVKKNRKRLIEFANLPSEPIWLNQTHSTRALNLDMERDQAPIVDSDASYTTKKNIVSAVLTADCLPILFCNNKGTEVASCHAGWKGLLDGVITSTVNALSSNPEDIMAWFGPAIGRDSFEVGEELKQEFIAKNKANEIAFRRIESAKDKFYSDIYQLARLELNNLGIESIFGGEYCTVKQEELFYSYRRDNVTGRMASLIWLD